MTIVQMLTAAGRFSHLPVFFTSGDESHPVSNAVHGDETGKDCLVASFGLSADNALTLEEISTRTETTRPCDLPCEIIVMAYRGTWLEQVERRDVTEIRLHIDSPDANDHWIELL